MSRTILIVDAGAADRTVLKGFLRAKYTVLEACSSAEMVSVLSRNGKDISVILLDLVMQGTDGFEALQTIRDNAVYRLIPVIAASAQSDEQTQARALSLGAVGFVSKPYKRDILLPLVENTVSLREASLLSEAFSSDAPSGQGGQISETEVTSARLRVLFDGINGGVSVVVYEDGGAVRLAYANDRYYRLFGYTKEQFETECSDPHEVIHADDSDSAFAAINKVKKTKQAATFCYRIIKRDKSTAYVRCNSSVTSLAGISGNVLVSILTDITESKQTEQQAVVSGQRLDAIMKNINSAVTASVVKSDGTVEILFNNELYQQMLGYTSEQYQNEVASPFQLIHPDDVNAVHDAVFGLYQLGDVKKLQYRVFTRDGKTKWLKARISLMTFPDAGEPVQLAVFTDITDMVKAQQQIAAQRDQIAELLDDTPSGIAIIEVNPADVSGSMHTTYYNDRFFSYSGYDRDEYDMLLQNNEMAFVFDEDIPALLSDTKRICREQIGASADTTVRCHTKDGGFRWLLLRGQLAARRGDICVIYIALIDVTEKMEAIDRQRINEEMLRAAAETDQRSMVIYNAKKNTCRVESQTLYSAKFGEVFENIPRSLIDMGLTAPESEDTLCSLFARIREGEKRVTVSLQLHSGPDQFEWFECNATTVFDADGLPDHAILVFHNITEQRVKEAVFKKWQQSITARRPESYTLFRCNLSRDAGLDEQEGELLKISFPADAMSFNSRTRLYADEFVYPDDRAEYIGLMDEDTLFAMYYRGEHFAALDYRETAANGETSWRRLTVEMVEYPNSTDIQAFLMYEDIDEMKKAELEAMELAKSDPLTGALNRAAFADAVDAMIQENSSFHSALIMFDMDGFKQINDTFGHAAGDQALQEVAAVLRAFSRKGDLVCRFGGDEFMVWLQDVPYDAVIDKTVQQMCDHIRKAYSREVLLSASAGIAVYPKDGQSFDDLYLNADKALYRIKQAGKGSYAFFNAVSSEQTADITEALSEIKPSAQSPRGSKHRMLIVDDSEINRLTLQNIFKDEYLIETAKNGAEAMMRLRLYRDSISVVLLDLLMPGIDGFTVLKKMQNNADLRVIPVIVVSGDEDHDTLLKAFDLGAAEYVTKPVDVDIIRMRVRAVINKAENERLRAQNSYLMLQRDEEMKYRTVLESTGTAVIEYDWRNHVYIYDSEISKHVAGKFDHRGLWQIFLSDMVAESNDVKTLQDALISLGSSRERARESKLVKLKTPQGEKHWFRMNIYKSVDEFNLTDKLIITFNDVHEEVLANDRLLFQATRDELTGLYNRTGFLEKASELIAMQEPGYYIMACIDVEKFQIINDRYGTDIGDEVLRHIADTVGGFVEKHGGICCRYTADKFAVIYPKKLLNTGELSENHRKAASPGCIPHPLKLRMGRCAVDDKTLSASAMFDRAAMAETMAKGRYGSYIIDYDASMRDSILKEQQIALDMVDALKNGEFEPWFQPQYNHATGALIGAEALVRWRKNGKIVSPNDFIPVFEKNGFIYEVDQYIWRSVCALLRRWLDEGKNPLPVSVNISRYDMFQENFIDVLTGLVEAYALPAELLRLEITESAFSSDTATITDLAGKLISAGFTVEIDDFGSGYSSLNTLKDVPASIIKLDMRFFEQTGDARRGGNIIESVVRMAKWLGMAVIAEGVEDKEQADYLKSIGCFYIQGYLYAKPMPTAEYEERLASNAKEAQLTHLKTLQDLDNNAFWDSHSMDTLIFNSYVGASCILECTNGRIEVIRASDMYLSMFGSTSMSVSDVLKLNWEGYLDADNISRFNQAVMESVETKKTVSDEFVFTGVPGCPEKVYVIAGLRVIATVGDRMLVYCLNNNITEQRIAEQERLASASKLEVVMNNVNGGVSAIKVSDDGILESVFNNEKYYELYGYTKEQAQAENLDVLRLILPEDIDAVMEKIKKLKRDKQPVIIDYGIKKRNGKRAILRANASLMSLPGYGDEVITSVITDVTEKRSLEDQLRAVVTNIYGAVSATYIDKDGQPQFVVVNDRFFEILGYKTREEYEADHPDKYTGIHPDDRERVIRQFETADGGKTQYTMNYRVVRKDGTVRHIRNNISVINMFGIDEPVQLSVANDITEQTEAEMKERNISAQMQTMMANIQGGVTATLYRNENAIDFVFANDGFYEMYGYTEEQMAAEMPNVLDLILPEDRKETMETVARIVKNRGSETYVYRCCKRDGSMMWTRCTNSVISIEGVGDTVLLGVSFDITKEYEAEIGKSNALNRLNTVMNTVTNGIAAVAFREEGMEFLFSNNRFYEIYGIKRGDIGTDKLRDALNYITPGHREKVRNAIHEAVREMKTVSTDYQIQRPDGMTRWINATINITRLSDINAPVMVAVITDITEQKETSEQLRFLNESAGEILAQPDSEKAINETLLKLQDYFTSERTYIFELNDERQTSDNTYEVCAPGITSEMERLRGIPYETQQCWFDAFDREGFVVISDVAAITNEGEITMRDLLLEQNIQSIIVVPLWRDNKMIGYIGTDNPKTALDQVSQLIALTDYIAVLLTRRDLIRSVEYGRQSAQQLIDDTPGGFLRLRILPDCTPVIVSYNEGFCRMLGMTGDEVMASYGDDAHKCMVAEDVATVRDITAESLAGNGVYTYKCRLRKKNGTFVWVQVFGRYVNGENGDLFRNSFFTDITEQKNTEQMQSDLLDNLPFGAAMYEFDGKRLVVAHINRQYWKLVGRQPTKYEKTPVTDAIHPEDRAATIQEIQSAIRQGRNAAVDLRILNGNGGYSPFHITASVVPQEEGKYKLFAAYTPVSNEAISLQEMLPIAMSTMMESSSDISYILSKDLHYISCSQALIDIAGLTDKNDIIGKNAYDLFDRTFADKFEEDDRHVIETGNPVIDSLEHIPASDGSINLARTSKYPICDASGDVIGVYSTSHDVSAQRRRDSQLDLLTKSIPGGLATYSVSNEGVKTIYYNDGYFAFSGYTREEYAKVIENEPLALVFEEDRDKIRALLAVFASEKQDGMTGSCDYRCHTKDGETRYMSLKASLALIDADQYILSVVQFDMTSHIEIEQRMVNLLDNLPFGAAMYEFDGKSLKALHINRQYQIMVGRDRNSANLEGFSPTDFIHPDDRLVALHAIKEAIASNRDAGCNIRILFGKDEYRPFHIDARIMAQPDDKHLVYAAYTRLSEQELTFENALPHMFATIMESSTDLAFAKDINFRYICCSKTFATLLGLKSEGEVVGKTDYELFPKKIADMFRQDDSALFATQKPQIDIQEMLPSPDGTKHYIRTSKHLMRSDTDTVIGIYCIGRDVTEVREAYTQLRLLTDSIPGGIATFRCSAGNAETIYFNDGICELAGYSREEYEAHPIPLLDLIFAEDRPVIHEQLELLQGGQKHFNFTARIHSKNGYKWLNIIAVCTDCVGDEYEVNAVLTDVTEQQEEKESLRLAEEEYRIATEHSARTICRYSIADQSMTIAHEAAIRLDLPVVLQGVPYAQMKDGSISSDTANNYLAFFEGILHGEKESACVYCRKLNNRWRWLNARATSVFDASGKPVSAIISFRDITEEQEKELIYKKWEQSLTIKKPEQYTLYRCNLNKDASYDTKEGSLFGFAVGNNEGKHFNECTSEFCHQYVTEDDRAKYIEFLDSDRMLAGYHRGVRSEELIFRAKFSGDDIRWIHLSLDLLEYPGSTDIEAYLMYEDVNDSVLEELQIKKQAETDSLTGLQNRKIFIEQVNRLLECKKKGSHGALFLLDIDYFKHINDTFGHRVGDESIVSMAGVILSVVRNDGFVSRLGGDEFLVYLPDMTSRESVSDKARALCEASHIIIKNDIRISVSIGIALVTDDGENFDSMYHKADKALYHVKGHGKNNFAFYDSDMDKDDNDVISDVISGPLNALAGGKTVILVVDDSAINRMVTGEIFKKEFTIAEAENGRAALDYIRVHSGEIAIILLDIMMPVMDGYELLAVLKADPVLLEIPVIVISGEDDRKASLRAIQAGASEYIVKPVDPELLRLRVSSALSKSENERLRKQNDDYAVDNQELSSYRSLIDSNATVLIEYAAKTGIFKYAPKMGKYLKGTFDGRPVWQIFAEDGVASDADADAVRRMIAKPDKHRKATFDLMTPGGTAHPFLIKVMLREAFENDDVVLITLTDRK